MRIPRCLDMEQLVHGRSPSEPGCSQGCLSGGPHYAESASVHFGEWDVLMWSSPRGAPLLSSGQESETTNLRRGTTGNPPAHEYF